MGTQAPIADNNTTVKTTMIEMRVLIDGWLIILETAHNVENREHKSAILLRITYTYTNYM